MNRRNPFEEFERLFDEMRRSTFGPGFPGREFAGMGDREERFPARFSAGDDRPRSRRGDWFGDRFSEMGGREDVNLTLDRTDDGYLVIADLPGFDDSEIDVRLDEDDLLIRAEHDVSEEREGHQHRRHRSVFERVTLPSGVMVDDISASYHNGVLEIDLPTDEELDDSRRIDIE